MPDENQQPQAVNPQGAQPQAAAPAQATPQAVPNQAAPVAQPVAAQQPVAQPVQPVASQPAPAQATQQAVPNQAAPVAPVAQPVAAQQPAAQPVASQPAPAQATPQAVPNQAAPVAPVAQPAQPVVPPATPAQAVVAEAANNAKKKILIVEDERPLAHALELKLSHDGYETFTAASGTEGLKQAEEGGYDLVLLDLILPELDGFELLRQLREKNKEIKVVILSNLGQEEDRKRVENLNVSQYCVKSNMPLAAVVNAVKVLTT